MKKLIVLFVICSCHQIYAQKLNINFGTISAEELEMTEYEQDKDAKAVILYDRGESKFIDSDNGYDIQFTRHKRIKIFDKSAEELTAVSIPFYEDGFGKTEKVNSIDAYTVYEEDGRKVRKRLDPSNIYEEQLSNNWKVKKFVFPDVQNGSVLEYQYTLITPFHFRLPDWNFQDNIPTIYSEYEVRMIPFYEYIFVAQGMSKLDYHHSELAEQKRTWGSVGSSYGQKIGSGVEFQDYVHTYVMKDIPAFVDESYISSINDYIVKIDFQLSKFHSPYGGTQEIISTWSELNKSLIKHERFGKYQKASSKLAKSILSDELEISNFSTDKQVKKIINYVKENFEWNGYESKYSSQSAKDFLKTKTGNSADINLFLIGMLEAAGIDAEPVILSTRSHGKISSDYPFDHFTNYVIALIKSGTPFLTDATENLLPYHRLPLRCFNQKGLMVNDIEEVQWVDLSNSISSSETKKLTMRLDSQSLDLSVNLLVTGSEYESYANRSKFENDSVKISNYYNGKIGEINRIKTMSYDNVHAPYSIYLISQFETEKIGNNIIVKPFLNLPLSKNNLTQKTRSYPVDFIYPWNEEFQVDLILPENFKVTNIPEDYHLNNDLVDINIEFSEKAKEITVSGNYEFKKSTYVQSEYARVKHYLDQIVKKFNEEIVLEKL